MKFGNHKIVFTVGQFRVRNIIIKAYGRNNPVERK